MKYLMIVLAVLTTGVAFAEDPATPQKYPFIGNKLCYNASVEEYAHDEMGLIGHKPTTTRTLKACFIVYSDGQVAQFSVFFPKTFVSWQIPRKDVPDNMKPNHTIAYWDGLSTDYDENRHTGINQSMWVNQYDGGYAVSLWINSLDQKRVWAVNLLFTNDGTQITSQPPVKKAQVSSQETL